MPTEDAMRSPYVETSRLRYDNGRAGRFRGAARQTQHGRRVAGLAARRMDTRWHNQAIKSSRKRERSTTGDALNES